MIILCSAISIGKEKMMKKKIIIIIKVMLVTYNETAKAKS
jgi:hypothetical protein